LRAKAVSLLGDAAAEALWRGTSDVDALSARDLARLMNE
jgi:hypothetical protein